MRKVDHYKIPPAHDRRRAVELTGEDREEITRLHKAGRSCRSLSFDYGVSPTLIQRIVNPEYAERQNLSAKERNYAQYATDPKAYVARNRKNIEYKKKLLEQGKLKPKPLPATTERSTDE